MDRRRFLALFSTASALAAFDASGYVRYDDSSISLTNYNLRFRPPSDWASYTAEQCDDAFPHNQVLPDGTTLPRPDNRVTPLFAYTREREPVFHFNPQIIVCGDCCEPLTIDDLLDAASYCHNGLVDVVDDVAVLEPPGVVCRNRLTYVSARIAFRFENTNGLNVRAVRQIELLSHHGMLFYFMLTNKSGRDLLDVQERFVESITPIARLPIHADNDG